MVFGAFDGAALVGAAGLQFEAREKARHKASLFGMYVSPSSRQGGVGRKLVQATLAQAASRQGVKIVQLTVTEGNAAAQTLYERCGFESFGVEPYAVALGDASCPRSTCGAQWGRSSLRAEAPWGRSPDGDRPGRTDSADGNVILLSGWRPGVPPRVDGMRILCLALAASLTACAVGPDYQRPALPEGVDAPAFKESGDWKPATPSSVDPSQPWWKAFGDARLDALIDAANLANQDIHAAEAQYRQAQALVQNAQSALFPTLNGAAGVGTAAEPDRARPVARQFPLVVAAGGLGT